MRRHLLLVFPNVPSGSLKTESVLSGCLIVIALDFKVRAALFEGFLKSRQQRGVGVPAAVIGEQGAAVANHNGAAAGNGISFADAQAAGGRPDAARQGGQRPARAALV